MKIIPTETKFTQVSFVSYLRNLVIRNKGTIGNIKHSIPGHPSEDYILICSNCSLTTL